MTTSEVRVEAAGPARRRRSGGGAARRLHSLRPSNISLVYMYAAGFILFTAWVPHLWLSGTTQKTILNISFAVPAMLAVGLMVPLLAGVFDLSISGTMDLSSVVLASLMIYSHFPAWVAILVVLGISVVVGAVNGFLVAVVGIDSFITTLASSAILEALAVSFSGNIQVTGFKAAFANFGSGNLVGGIQYQVLYVAVIAVVVWYVVEHTAAGRYLQATGENEDAARLSGVPTKRYIFTSLIVSAVIAAFAGCVETAVIGAGESNVGDPYLLTAFAAAFLGATQFKQRFNVLGTVAGVWVLASGVEGVTVALKSYAWLNQLFFGSALIVAVGIGRVIELNNGRIAVRRRRASADDGEAVASLVGAGPAPPGPAPAGPPGR